VFPVEIVLTRDSIKRRHIFFSAAQLMNALATGHTPSSTATKSDVQSMLQERQHGFVSPLRLLSHIAVTFSYFKNIEFNARKHVNTAHAATRSGLLSTFIAQS
jgi:hypothetical protein